jgi:23S rRNA pseudouridine1911/1915/1917 synthase
VAADAAPGTVGRWLARELGLSTTLVRKLKATPGGIRVNGAHRRTVDALAPGDEVVLSLAPDPAPNVAPEPMSLAVVHEDRDLVVLDKAPGVVVHPTHGVYTGTLANGLAQRWLDLGVPAGIHPVHRLDRQTSGLIVFAKHPLAHQRLDAQLLAHKLEREYVALVWGRPAADAGEVDLPIALAGGHPVARAVREGGQAAQTAWTVVERYDAPGPAGAALLRLVLRTGRTHQIRVHMAAIGHPLLGDTLYAEDRAAIAPRQALHAATLAFRHPRTGEPMRFEAPLPPDLAAVLEGLARG